MTKIKSVHKNLVPALLELKNGCRVIENKGKIGKGIQFKSNSVCLFCLFFFFSSLPHLGMLVGLIISKCKVSVSSSFFPGITMVAWEKVSFCFHICFLEVLGLLSGCMKTAALFGCLCSTA